MDEGTIERFSLVTLLKKSRDSRQNRITERHALSYKFCGKSLHVYPSILLTTITKFLQRDRFYDRNRYVYRLQEPVFILKI